MLSKSSYGSLKLLPGLGIKFSAHLSADARQLTPSLSVEASERDRMPPPCPSKAKLPRPAHSQNFHLLVAATYPLRHACLDRYLATPAVSLVCAVLGKCLAPASGVMWLSSKDVPHQCWLCVYCGSVSSLPRRMELTEGGVEHTSLPSL